MILNKFNLNISTEDLLTAYKVITDMMENSGNCLNVDQGFIRVRNYLANCLVTKTINEQKQ